MWLQKRKLPLWAVLTSVLCKGTIDGYFVLLGMEHSSAGVLAHECPSSLALRFGDEVVAYPAALQEMNDAQYVIPAQPYPDQSHLGLDDLTFLPALQFNYDLIMLLCRRGGSSNCLSSALIVLRQILAYII